MSEAMSIKPTPPAKPPRRSRRRLWFAAVVGLVAGAAFWLAVWKPYRVMQAAVVELNQQNVAVTTEGRGPDWLLLLNVGGLLDRIVEIQLRGTNLAGLRQQHFSESLSRLERVLVFDADLTRDDVALLRQLPNLQLLSVSNGRLNEDAVDELASLESLQGLFLHKTNIRDADLDKLARLRGLETLSVTDAAVTDNGLTPLRSLLRLKTLNLGHTQVTDAGVETFQTAVPECTVFYK
jgi:hypothetical protein